MAMPKTNHPTKSSLIECAADLLDKYRFDEITVEMILDRSSISKGSLYHHFEDIYHLLEAAMIVGTRAMSIPISQRCKHSYLLQRPVKSSTLDFRSYLQSHKVRE